MGNNSKKAFTLAEVLITLGVIGVVSAMTMPTLIQHHQKQVTVAQLKKAYSEFAQALQKAEAEHGLMETWDFAYFGDDSSGRATYFGENYLFPYIKTIKKCIPTSNACWADNIKALGAVNANTMINGQNTHNSFVTPSNYSVYYWLDISGKGMWYYVDINGVKPPNIVGKDIFAFKGVWGQGRTKYGAYPYGLESDTSYTRDMLLTGTGFSSPSTACVKGNAKQNGRTCAAVIMLDGWKITDTYPW